MRLELQRLLSQERWGGWEAFSRFASQVRSDGWDGSSLESQLLALALQLLSAEHWDGFFSLAVILILYRRTRYLSAALARQQRQAMRLVNETWKTALETVLREQPRRLRDLVEDTENESSHRP